MPGGLGLRRYFFQKDYAEAVQKLRVPSGLLLLAAFIWFARPNVASLSAGVPFSLSGLLLRGWAAGHLAKNERLATSGPFSFVRNPLYLGTLITASGVLVASQSVVLAALVIAVFALVYLPVIEREEQHLRQLFPEYEEYARLVPLLIPRWRVRSGDAPFRWSLYLRNQEYKALAGCLIGFALLIWKAIPSPS